MILAAVSSHAHAELLSPAALLVAVVIAVLCFRRSR
jgi:hypothetical protein